MRLIVAFLASVPPFVEDALKWFALVTVPVGFVCTLYWIFWHRGEKPLQRIHTNRMLREEESRYAEVKALEELREEMRQKASVERVSALEGLFTDHSDRVRAEIDKIYAEMKKDAKAVGDTFRTLTHEIGEIVGELRAKRKQ
jgi:hypothetical protein